MPPPIKHVILKLMFLNSRLLVLFDEFPDVNCKYWVDNVHTSVNFVAQSLKHESYSMVEGACKKGGRVSYACAKKRRSKEVIILDRLWEISIQLNSKEKKQIKQ